MRNVKLAGVLVALVLAGCSGGGDGATGPSTTPTTATGTTRPSPPPQSSAPPLPDQTAVPPERLDAGALSDAYERQAWVSADGRTVRVLSLAGGCKRASAEVAAQSADQVRITLVTTYYPPDGGACTQELYDVPVHVSLDAPLGDRLLVLEAREQTA
ncbi:hypothetical protein [Saccharothrix obliqua]|uniref:hypothetical protein n=1 Tax=Saccharothrix obliqua TaxID=2861747 RepID=UPI001C5D78D7|nr:hypothetical protein [Saccharothrix obliqua]MBW4722212.1 hypothetical protein [Saccharothrix obliqua]